MIFVSHFLLVFHAFSHSTEFASDEELLGYIEVRIDEAYEIGPSHMIDITKQYLIIADEKNWKRSKSKLIYEYHQATIAIDDYEQARQIQQKYLPYARNTKDYELLITLLSGEIYLNRESMVEGEYDQEYREIVNAVPKVPDAARRANAYWIVSQTQYYLFKFDEAISSLTTALELYSALENENGKAYVYYELGKLYFELGDYNNTVNYYKQTLEIQERLGQTFNAATAMEGIGIAYNHLEDYVNSEKYFRKSIELSLTTNNDFRVARSTLFLADTYRLRERFDEALKYYAIASNKFKELQNPNFDNDIFLGRAIAYANLDEFDKAKAILSEHSDKFETYSNPKRIRIYKQLLAQMAERNGEYKNATSFYKDIIQLNESIFEQHIEQESRRSVIEFSTKITKSHNHLLESQNELKSLRIAEQQRKANIWGLMVICLTVVVVSVLTVFFVVLKNKKKFEVLALKDELTQVSNRRAMLSILSDRLSKTDDKGAFSLAILDIDHFKKINDAFGHNVGDKVLKAFASKCCSCLRSSDSFGRYGGEEWMLVCDVDDKDLIREIFERFRASIETIDIDELPSDHGITFSMGVSIFNGQSDIDKMINEADEKLYIAKENGRNCVVV